MNNKLENLFNELLAKGISEELQEKIRHEINLSQGKSLHYKNEKSFTGFYEWNDFKALMNDPASKSQFVSAIKTIEDLLEQDKQREQDGFHRRIRIGKLMKPTKDKKTKVVVVPSTTEPKFYHDDSITEDNEESTGGTGDEEEGEVLGEQQAEPEEGEGEGQGAGQGQGTDHDITSEAFDLGRVLTQKFNLPNLKVKGKKRSLTQFVYDLTDRNRGHGQVLDKKATLKRIVETNIQLGNIDATKDLSPEEFAMSPQDLVYRILSKEKDFENQAVVFFLRDYSGSMQGKPTEAITTQHLLIYSWLMYQYQNNVQTRFIVHDTDAKEVPDFYTYYKSAVAGGTRVAPAFQLVNKIVENEHLAADNNIYIFHGTDGDDWDSDGKELTDEIQKMLTYANRLGITIAKNSWTNTQTTVETTIINSGLLKEKAELIKLDAFSSEEANEERIIESIKKLIS